MDDIDQAMVIDSAQVGRMASSRADGRRTTMYGRHRRKPRKPLKSRPVRPVEPLMAAVMAAFAVLWLAGILAAVWLMPMSAPAPWAREAVSAVCAAASVCAPVPAWAYLVRHIKEGKK